MAVSWHALYDKSLNVLLILKIQDQKNMNSGQSAGISPYDCPAVIINIFIIDNFLSIGLR
jgi:hypothetical protein